MPPPKRAEPEVRITLRLPQSVHDALVQRAASERRSLNAEIVYLVEQVLHPLQSD